MNEENRLEETLRNYHNRRHLLQNMHLPAEGYRGPRFVYIKNHKAACSNVLSFLLTHLHHSMELAGTPRINMESLHHPSLEYLRAGARGLGWDTAKDALFGPDWYRFTVIREPLSRTVSAWADKVDKARYSRHRHSLMRHLGRDMNADLSLPDFLHIMATDPVARDLDRHWRPQHKEVSYETIDYDRIGRVEELDDFRQTIAREIFGLVKDRLRVLDTRHQLGHKTSSKDFREGLTARDRRNVKKAFAADFDMYETIRHQGTSQV